MIEKETLENTKDPESTVDYFKKTISKLGELNRGNKYSLLLEFGEDPTGVVTLTTEIEINSLRALPKGGIQCHNGFGSPLITTDRLPKRISIITTSEGKSIEIDSAELFDSNQYMFPPL
jgi:hypothetical protein